jgi:cytochrome c biogenesis protein CcmG/thiol:disulfide interchange protein DsbE
VIAAVRARAPGDTLHLGVRHGAATRTVDVSLEAMPSQDDMLRREWQGEALPTASLSAVRGSVPPKLEGLKGRVVVLAFEATWCGVCGATQPVLEGWQKRFGAQGLTVLGVDAEPKDLVAAHVARGSATFPVVVDPDEGGLTGSIGVSALPTLIIAGRDGRVRDVIIGYDEDRWAGAVRLVETLLDEKAAPMPSRR